MDRVPLGPQAASLPHIQNAAGAGENFAWNCW